MTRNELVQAIKEKGSYLCVGLDTDLTKTPSHLGSTTGAIVDFNKAIIDATLDHCVAYKINTAFYEAYGVQGWEALEQTVKYIPTTHFKIADAKRGDIGNTSLQYAKAFFDAFDFDAITVAPYMGEDSVRPFLEYSGKWAIVLGLTSNPGANDFELQHIIHRSTAAIESNELALDVAKQKTEYLYEHVLRTVSGWGSEKNLMFVIGATQAEQFERVRNIIPNHFILVPGVGAQGGSLKEISERAMTKDCGLLVNASRAIIYASTKEDYAEKAKEVARDYHDEMKEYLKALS